MAGCIPLSMTQQFNVYGEPLSGGQLYIIQAGTVSTPQDAFQDTGLSIKQPYPMTLDAAGRVPQFFLADGSVKIRLQDAHGVVQLAADSVLVIGPSAGGGGGSTVDPTQLIQTGSMIFRYGIGALAGYVRLNDKTIGSATSGATERANSDTQALFLYLWGIDATLVVSGGRGASAAADWAANKTIALPDFRGYTIGALDDMGNTASGRISTMAAAATTLGGVGGAQTYTILTANLPPYTPAGAVNVAASGSVNLPFNGGIGYTSGGGVVAYQRSNPNQNDAAAVTVSITSSTFTGAAQGGASTAFNILDPRKNITFYMKL